MNIDIKKIEPYFTHRPKTENAFPNDTYQLFDGLIFIDFWEKIGIQFLDEFKIPNYRFELSRERLVEDLKKILTNYGCSSHRWNPY